MPEGLILPQAEALIAATGVISASAAIAPSTVRPKIISRYRAPTAYFEPINWHRTALHEIGHWTGARKSRLDRDLSGGFGSRSTHRRSWSPK